jgi:prepilin-type N-terminal cleavage/methylation domain-containing protein
MKGFTLVELIVVFSVIGILTSLGLASYSSYNGKQTVQSAATDVVTMLNTAKSQSLSQVIPSSCASNPVTGYQVDVTVGSQQYTLSAICGTKQVITTSNLPAKVTFDNGSTTTVFYPIATGTIANASSISITGYGITKIISISQAGTVSVN